MGYVGKHGHCILPAILHLQIPLSLGSLLLAHHVSPARLSLTIHLIWLLPTVVSWRDVGTGVNHHAAFISKICYSFFNSKRC